MFLLFPDMKLKINGIQYTNESIADNTQTLIQACEVFGYNIPRFCYHQKLSVAGNCRMCLVEVENSAKPVASCAVVQTSTMSIYTDGAITNKAREAVMEFLLLNHPLDCPICDQGGECDLQDQAMLFGNDTGRYYVYKRSVTNKNIGPLVKMVMTRCIHCTRCVRFATDIAGVQDLGVTGRGSAMEISTYLEKMMRSELSGNVIDLCPVGALTSKPYAFTGRSWELTSIDTIDISDSMGSSVVHQVISGKLLRVLPKANEKINGDWITDKARFSYDGIVSSNRIYNSRESLDNSFFKIGVNKRISICGESSDVQEMIYYKSLFNSTSNYLFGEEEIISSNLPNTFYGPETSFFHHANTDFAHFYKFNTTFYNIDKSDFTLLIGCDLKIESPLLHSKLSTRLRHNSPTINYIGSFIDSRVGSTQLGNSELDVQSLFNGTAYFCQSFVTSSYPTVLLGNSKSFFLNSTLFVPQLFSIAKYVPNLLSNTILDNVSFLWNGINVLLPHANSFFSKDLHIHSKYTNLVTYKDFFDSSLYLHRLDNTFYNTVSYTNTISNLNSGTTTVAQSHSDSYTHFANDVFSLPHAYEKISLFVNNEGLCQVLKPSLSSQGEISSNTYDNLFSYLSRQDKPLSLSFNQLLDVKKIFCPSPSSSFDTLYSVIPVFVWTYGQKNRLSYWIGHNYISPYNNSFYMTEQISRSSYAMSKCESVSLEVNLLRSSTSY